MDKLEFTGLLDKNAVIIEFSDQSGISGYTAKEVIGKKWFDIFIDESDRLEVQHVFSSLFYGEETHWFYDNYIICKDGTKKLMQFKNKILKNEKEEPQYIFFTARETDYIFTTPEDI